VSVRRLLLLLPAVVALSACGGGEDETELLARSESRDLTGRLERIERAVARGDCTVAREAVARLGQEVANLDERRDAALRERLREGVDNLAQAVDRDCTQTETTETVTTETTPTETVPTETTPPPTQPVPTETTPPPTQTQPPPTQTAPPETLPQQPETPADPGGQQAPGEGLDG